LYYLGLAWKMLGDAEKAKEYFMLSSSGNTGSQWAGNDWPEVMFSRALAFRELGNTAQAEQLFRDMMQDAEKALHIPPDPVAYTGGVENRWDKRIQTAKAYYMMALGNLGMGNKTSSDELFAKALETEPSFLSAKSYRFSW